MPIYKVVLKNGRTIDIDAESMLDDPDLDEIYFYYDDSLKSIFATVKRASLLQLTILTPKAKPVRLRVFRKPPA